MNALNQKNQNTARSEETQRKLTSATINSLVEVGFARTTGVEVCRRAGVTRGALNHHFPVFSDLLISALNSAYLSMRDTIYETKDLTMVQFVELSYLRVIRPEFKAVIELWLASQNEPAIGAELTQAIKEGFSNMMPTGVFGDAETDPDSESLFVMFFELLIALGLGRATSGGEKSTHEDTVYQMMIKLAAENDRKRANKEACKQER